MPALQFIRLSQWLSVGIGFMLMGAALAGFISYDEQRRPTEHELSVVAGPIVGASRLVRTSRRGSKSTYFLLEVQPPQPAASVTVRISEHDVPEHRVKAILNRAVVAKYDPNDEGLLYELQAGGEMIRSYAQTAEWHRTNGAGATGFAYGMIGLGALAALFGFFQARRRAAALDQETL